MCVVVISFFEDCGVVERDDVDIVYLLCKYDSRSIIICFFDMGDDKDVFYMVEVGGVRVFFFFDLVDDIGVVVVVGGNDGVSVESFYGLEVFGKFVVFYELMGRFGVEIDFDGKEEGGNEGRVKLEMLRDVICRMLEKIDLLKSLEKKVY